MGSSGREGPGGGQGQILRGVASPWPLVGVLPHTHTCPSSSSQ